MRYEGQENPNTILLKDKALGQENLRIIPRGSTKNPRIISLADSEIPGQENPSIILSES